MKRLLPILFAVFTFQFLPHNTRGQVCFTPAVNFGEGAQSYSVISGDFNNDLKLDLAMANYIDQNVAVLLGDGLGGFGTITNFAVGVSPCSIISADFNGDGNPDLATANLSSNNVSVLLGNGMGGFGTASNFPIVGTNPRSIISADFNADGNLDLATANLNSNNISILLGNGLGGFGAATSITVGVEPWSIISVDFNLDGKPDLATANNASGNVSVLLGDGIGGFGTATNFAVGTSPFCIISGDFNSDGKADLAVGKSLNVSVLIGNGLGNFASAINITSGTVQGIKAITCADYNGDGKIDLGTANSTDNNISLILGNGVGNFGTPTNFAVGLYPYCLISVDFNGDGKPDIATRNYYSSDVSVLLNTLVPIVTANATATAVCRGASVTLTGGGASTYTWTGGIVNGVAIQTDTLSTNTYTVTGTIAGCSNTATKTITINPLPTATFTTQNESSSLYCDGSIKAHLTGGTGTILPQWLDSAQTVLASIDSIGALCHGIYMLYLSDANNCTNIYSNTINAGPIPPTPPLCLVTLNSTLTHNLIVWEKTNLNLTTIDSFVVYREITTNNYHRIGAVSKDSLSIFNDLGANPATTGYRYKLESKNAQGVVSLLSDYHNTVYLTNTGANFNWTPYQIENNTTPVSTYNVYRDNISDGNFILIGNTTGNQFGFTDVQYSSFPNSQYYVEAVMAGGVCQPTRSSFATSRSNVKHIGMSGVQQLNTHSIINIYPNPASNTLTVTGISNKTTIRLYDFIGKLIFEKEVENNTSINTNLLADGVYTLLTENKFGKTFDKVVISH